LTADTNPSSHKEYRSIPGRSVLCFLAVCAAGYLALLVMAQWLRPEISMMQGLGIFFAIGLVAVAVAVRPLGPAAGPALGLRPVTWKYPLFGAIATLALSVGVSQFGIEPEGMKQVLEVVRAPRELLVSLLLIGGLAPLVEELVFRGLLYGWIAGRWGSIAGLVVSSLAFAAAHYEPAHIILVLPLGVLFGGLRWRSGSLLPSLVAHMANNSFAVLAAAFLSDL
jgi:membrane protease YdiL (CAAX protease family)